jgi:methylglutaconyl-CoA hydratase
MLHARDNVRMHTSLPARLETGADSRVMAITLADAPRRNALGAAMFDALEAALAEAGRRASAGDAHVLLLRAEGSAFCAGFDLAACVADAATLESFIHRLSGVIVALRSMPAVVVAQVQGAALAGGCAILTGCDIVCAAERATFGYPVHRIGVSPAVSLPTLVPALGAGAARELALLGEPVPAMRAHQLGLVHRLHADADALAAATDSLVASLAAKGPQALRETKSWLSRLDGTDLAADGSAGTAGHAERGDRASRDLETVRAAAAASAALCAGDECRTMLKEFWSSRSRG